MVISVKSYNGDISQII